MAAEHVFYGENSTGVGGDVQSATARAAWMVGACAMGPEPYVLGRFADETSDETRARVKERLRRLGGEIMNRTSGGPLGADLVSSVLGDREKRAMVAELLGQAYLAAYGLVAANREAVEHIADVLVERRELHGNEVVSLLNDADLRVPTIDLTEDAPWPKL
jgi:ATP-dependent Zn protease